MKVLITIIFVLAGMAVVDAFPVGRGRMPRSPRSKGVRSAVDPALVSESGTTQEPIKHRAFMLRPRIGHHSDFAFRKATFNNIAGDLQNQELEKRDVPLRHWQRHAQWKKAKLLKKKKGGKKSYHRHSPSTNRRDKAISKAGLGVIVESIQPSVVGSLKLMNLESRSDEGVPGFVEIAVPLHDNSLAKNVAGLVYAPSSGDTDTGFEVRMSEKHSTQFLLKKVATINDIAQYQLQVPILDSVSLTPILQCITFALDPPAPLSLQKCLKDLPIVPDVLSGLPVVSQIFSYERTSGQLLPMRIVSPNSNNSTVNATQLAVVVDKGTGSQVATSPSAGESVTDDEDNFPTGTTATPTSTSDLPEASPASNSLSAQVDHESSLDGSVTSDAPHVLLFFVPTNTITDVLYPLDATPDSTSNDNQVGAAISTTVSTNLPTPSPMMANANADNDSVTNCPPNASDSLCNSVKTVSVTRFLTSTVAAKPTPTPS